MNSVADKTKMRSADQLADEFQQNGAVMIEAEELPMGEADWQQLDAILASMDYEKVVGGDTGDAHSVWVGRFVNDVTHPEPLHPMTGKVLGILMSDKMNRFFSSVIGAAPLCVRRCQANRLESGDFIGYHIDQDTTPDYLATAIFQLSGDYDGGEFIVYHPDRGDFPINFPRFSVLLNRGDIPHEVTSVKQGTRSTLACFFSTNFGPTRKPRSQIKVVEHSTG